MRRAGVPGRLLVAVTAVLTATAAAVGVLSGGPVAPAGAQTSSTPESLTAFGDAVPYGSVAGADLVAPIAGVAGTPDGKGYWIVTDLGVTYNFGDAPQEGSAPVTLAAPVVGMAATPDGKGYWMAAADGGVFTLGDAGFFGSLGATPLNAPVVGMATTPDGKGYWLVGADGGVFAFGDAAFYGSLGSAPPDVTTPAVGMAAMPDGGGYWLTTTAKAIPPPTATTSVLAACNQPSAGPSVEPTSIVLACGDGNALLTDLRWSSWTATTAAATGDLTHNTCTPDCARGTFVSTPATVSLGYPVRTLAGVEFSTATYTYAVSTAPGGVTFHAVLETTVR